MVSRVKTIAFNGIEGIVIDVQAYITAGMPAFHIVGLPDKSIAESKERIKAAFHSIGIALSKRITINLSPADVYKVGTHYDLPIAMALLAEFEVINQQDIEGYIAMGELSLDGKIQDVTGALPAAIFANAHGLGVICSWNNAKEVHWSGNENLVAPHTITEVINFFNNTQILEKPTHLPQISEQQSNDMQEIKGQKIAKRCMEIAAAGNHNFLMVGPPGSGKSMLAKAMPSILPPLVETEILEVNMIKSITGQLNDSLKITRPFRAPHCSSSTAALVGGGRDAKPGEVTLAHGGVLFLDELPEFSRNSIEALRQPIECNHVTIARANAHITYPANFQLIAAMNPCRCGYFGDVELECGKSPKCSEDYQERISGPLLDRFDMQIGMTRSESVFLQQETEEESSQEVLKRVMLARAKQKERYKGTKILTNSEATSAFLHKMLDDEEKQFLDNAIKRFKLSMRAITRVLRVALTIADLSLDETGTTLNLHNISEALSYRIRTRKVN